MKKIWKGSLQRRHLLQLLYVAWSTIRDELCLQTRTLSMPLHGTNHIENVSSPLKNVPLTPCLVLAKRESQLCICPESWPYIDSICVLRICISLPQLSHHHFLSRPINPPRSPSSPPPSPSQPSPPRLWPPLFSSAPSPSQPAHTLCFPQSSSVALHLAPLQSSVRPPQMISPVSFLGP